MIELKNVSTIYDDNLMALKGVNLAIKHLVHGAGDKAFGKKKDIAQALAEEIMLASESNGDSFAYRKKNESEKQADSAR